MISLQFCTSSAGRSSQNRASFGECLTERAYKYAGGLKAKKAMTKKELEPSVDVTSLQPKAMKILDLLRKLYPNPLIPLNHNSHFQLLCAVLLTAQFTDAKMLS